MEEKEFLVMLNEMEQEERRIMGVKGIEYTQGDAVKDRLANFYRLADELNIDPKLVCWIYLKKHIDSIVCYIKNNKEYSEEKIDGRIHDARNYLVLLNGIIQQQKGDKNAKT
jgi:hypothetical protein